MAATLLIHNRAVDAPDATAEGDDLWLPLRTLEERTGWTLKPEGACRGEICVPLPRGRESDFSRGGRFSITALARHLDQPVVRDTDSGTWAIGESAAARQNALQSLEAPDFTLPDLDGRMHSLSDYRGKKVFLVSWASW
jgi:hypothetical protein